ncbi:uncharacterized protein TM35_000451100, partial [Trypanosoma theileri]
MMMMMRRVMCVLAVVLCCACGYTMTAAATTTAANAGQPKAVMAVLYNDSDLWSGWSDFPLSVKAYRDQQKAKKMEKKNQDALKQQRESEALEEAVKTQESRRETELERSTQESQVPESVVLRGEGSSHLSTSGSLDDEATTLLKVEPKGQPNGSSGILSENRDLSGSTKGESRVQPLTRTDQQPNNDPSINSAQDGATSHASPRTEKPTTTHVAEITKPFGAERPLSGDHSSGTTTKTTESQTQEVHSAVPKEQNKPTQGNQESSNNTGDINTPGNSNPTEQSPAAAVPTATESSNENDTTSQPSPANTVSEESTTTPSRDSNATQQSTATDDVTAASASHETNTTT